jgi:lambda repressor-like predicted transcriptional regulator
MPRKSAKELAARKEWARLEDETRQWMKAKITELEKQGWSSEQIRDELGLSTLEQIRDELGLEYSPAKQFLFDRLKGVDDANIYDEMYRAMVDLLRSDIPLDRYSRQSIAESLWRLAFPNPARDARQKRRVQAAVAEDLKRFLQYRGEPALKAEQLVAEALGVKSVDALRKRRQRAK